MSIAVKPLHDKVIVKVLEAETKTAGGIIIPDSAKQKPQEAKVVAVGNGKKTEDGKVIPLDVKVGDQVYFTKWGGTEIKISGEDYIILSESDILAVKA
jgi:chaperonin GroES